MPEGPEVKWMVDQINQHIIQKKKPCRLLDTKIVSGRYTKHGPPDNYQTFQTLLQKDKIYLKEAKSKGKFIYIIMENSPWSIWLTLGMSGHLLLEQTNHLRITFHTSNGDFYLNDMRNFGTLTFCPTEECLNAKLKQIGPDLLSDSKHMKPGDFVEIMRKIKQDKLISIVLVDQKKISGIGNYLRAEILYHAKVSPFKKLKDLSDEELKKLYQVAQKILKESYEIQSKNGLHTFPFQIYMKDEDLKGNPVQGDKLPDKRTIWWVPAVQH